MWTDNTPAAAMPPLFETGADLISFSGGLPDLEILPVEEISAQLSSLVRLGGRLALQYSTPHVARALVPAITDLMGREGMRGSAADLVPTGGSQMGLMAVALGLGTPGETALCQTPAYPGAMAAFRTAGLRLCPVPEDLNGMDPEGLRETVVRLRAAGRTAKLLYCSPTFQNPTGRTMSHRRRVELVAVCQELGLTAIEDNPYGLLAFDGTCTAALKAIAPEQVVYLGSFSKVFAPGLRCGWIDAPRHLSADLRRTTEAMALSPSALAQAAIAAFYNRSGWSGLLAAYQQTYRERHALMADALAAQFAPSGPWKWERPNGGFYIWMHHQKGADTSQFFTAAAEQGVSFVPGRYFGIGGGHAHGLRLCYSNVPRKQIAEGVSRLAAALSPAGPEQEDDIQ